MLIYICTFWILLTVTVLAAYRWGGPPERNVAALYVMAAVATVLVRPSLTVRYHAVEANILIVDLLLLIGLTWVAVRADRWWPICAAALQTISVLAPFAKAINPELYRLGYQLMEELVGFPMVMLLAVGTIRHRRRALRHARRSSGASSRTDHPEIHNWPQNVS